MKRFAIIGLIILIIGAFILVPLLKNSGSEEITDGFPASFNFDENLASNFGKDIPIVFTVKNDDIAKVELIYNDSVFKTWNAPKKGTINFLLDADFYGVGTKSLVLRSTLKDGGSEEDLRMLRILSDISPAPLTAEIVNSYPHDTKSYTQGLEFNNGQLYEGTGNPQNTGESVVAKVNLTTGALSEKNALDATYFGEGITMMGDELFQLTWRDGKCFVYDKNTLTIKLKEFAYTGEGWGLCNDGKYLIMSDGSERITFRDPKTFQPVRTIEVYDNVGPRTMLNELEYKDGKIYANVYQTNFVITIDPLTGKVLEQIDATALAAAGKMGGDVLNGIAYNAATNKLYMTGKYWGKLFEVKLVE